MRKIFFCLLIAANCITYVNAQVFCDGIRYNSTIFSSVDTIKDVVYGNSITNTGANLILKMDIYQPAGDTAQLRPLLIFAHGGSFVTGTRKDADVVTICNKFAKMGYITASIEYRLGITSPFNQANTTLSVMRAVQDMKASVRYFYMTAQTGNAYKIDTTQIWIGGSSAGAITALHMAYLDKTLEVPVYIDTAAVGGFEGLSGNPGFSVSTKGVINLCGALGEKRWLENNDLPLVSVHGTNDNVVPYGTATLYLLNVFPIMPVDGSGALDLYADSIQTESDLKTFIGAGHVPYAGSAAYMDSTVTHVKNFLFDHLSCNLISSIPQIEIEEILAFPQPSSGLVRFSGINEKEVSSIRVYDLKGQLIIDEVQKGNLEITIPRSGSYVAELVLRNGTSRRIKLMISK